MSFAPSPAFSLLHLISPLHPTPPHPTRTQARTLAPVIGCSTVIGKRTASNFSSPSRPSSTFAVAAHDRCKPRMLSSKPCAFSTSDRPDCRAVMMVSMTAWSGATATKVTPGSVSARVVNADSAAGAASTPHTPPRMLNCIRVPCERPIQLRCRAFTCSGHCGRLSRSSTNASANSVTLRNHCFSLRCSTTAPLRHERPSGSTWQV